MTNIRSMSDKTGDGTLRSPEDALIEALNDYKKGGVLENSKKVLILALDDNGGVYDVKFLQAGMRMSECISICEIAKTIFLTQMEYIYSGD